MQIVAAIKEIEDTRELSENEGYERQAEILSVVWETSILSLLGF